MPLTAWLKSIRYGSLPLEQLPKIDGNAADWEAVPDSFVISIDRMKEDEGRYTSAKKSTLMFGSRWLARRNQSVVFSLRSL